MANSKTGSNEFNRFPKQQNDEEVCLALSTHNSVFTKVKMLAVEIIEGKRKKSIVYKVDEHLYNGNKEQLNRINVICYDKNCPGKGVISKSDLTFSSTQAHICDGHSMVAETLRLESEMKKLAESTCTGFREIFDTVSLTNPEAAASISFPALESTMKSRRRAARP